MGIEYRKNYKNLVGKPNLVGHDTFDSRANVGAAPAVNINMTEPYAQVGFFVAAKDIRLDAFRLDMADAISIGGVTVTLLIDAVVVASLSVSPTDLTPLMAFDPVNLQSLYATKGSVVSMKAEVTSAIDGPTSVRGVLMYTLLEHRE